ncbi:MAG: choice-of-anchor J domain-containing protein [Gemmatimonadaceae bacterium]|nr:choice-of-anchor J domain-containing protein [Chitinophagaceae bacterium]
MKKFYFLLLTIVIAGSQNLFSQVTLSGSSYSQNFDNLGVGLPAGWSVRTGANAGSEGTVAAFAVAPVGWSTTTGNFRNVASADGLTSTSTATAQNASTDRALAVRQTGAFGDPGAAFVLQLTNTVGFSGFELDFSLQSLDAASTRITEWKVDYAVGATPTNFIALTTIPANSTTGGATFSSNNISVNFGSALDNISETVWIRITTKAASTQSNNRPTTGIDDFLLSYSTGGDVNPPSLGTVNPATNSVNNITDFTATAIFDETILKASGNILIKDFSTDAVVETIDVTSPAVTVSGSTVSFKPVLLQAGTRYYVEISSGAFTDASANAYAGLTGNATWNFTTIPSPAAAVIGTLYDFNTCGAYLSQGFRQYSRIGAQTWGCVKFGRTFVTDPSTDSAIQMNGFASTSQANEDWFISPKYDLTGTNTPLLKFYSRNNFAGDQLTLKVSTNYTGSGDPANATWIEVAGKFPAEDSDVWTLSDSINLSAFKSNSVYIAWIYTSSTASAARWILDDIIVVDGDQAAAPYISAAPAGADFGYVPAGSNSYWKRFKLSAADFTGNLTLSVPASFAISKDSSAPANSIVYTPAEANSGTNYFYVRFSPVIDDQQYAASVNAAAAGFNLGIVNLAGTSLSAQNTLDVVNWNIEWFGSPAQDPSNDNQQEANVKTILRSMDADLYAFSEIVDTARFRRVVDSLGSAEYGFAIADYASFAPNDTDPDFSSGQKNGFIYRKSVFTNVSTRALLRTHATQEQTDSTSYWWASGRFPFMLTADATVHGITKTMNFVVIHAKANTGADDVEKIEAYRRRKMAVAELKDTLDTHFASASLLLLGDFNDDFDRSIAPTTGADTVSSYAVLIADSTDGNSYKALTLPLSLAGQRSTVGNTSVIDHVVATNEMSELFINSSAQIRTDIAALVTNYANTTTDHYPVQTRFNFLQGALPVKLNEFTAIKNREVVDLSWSTSTEINTREFVIERAADGKNFRGIGSVAAAALANGGKSYQFSDLKPMVGNNFYRLRIVDIDRKEEFSKVVKVNFAIGMEITVSPNPVSGLVYVSLNKMSGPVKLQLFDLNGRVVKQKLVAAGTQRVGLDVLGIRAGVYTLKASSGSGEVSRKLLVN